MHFNLVDETGNPTPHEMTRTITHVEYDGQLDDLCLVCYAPVPKKYDLDAVKTLQSRQPSVNGRLRNSIRWTTRSVNRRGWVGWRPWNG